MYPRSRSCCGSISAWNDGCRHGRRVYATIVVSESFAGQHHPGRPSLRRTAIPEELIHEPSHLLFLGEGEHVPPLKDLEGRIGDQSRHNPGIDGWNDRVILPSQDKRWLTYPVQPGYAGPAQARN